MRAARQVRRALPSCSSNTLSSGTPGASQAPLRGALLLAREVLAPLAGGVLVGVGRFGGGAFGFGNVAQIDANAGPGGGAATHGIDEHVVDGELGGGAGMTALPALEAGEGSGLVGRIGDRDERHLRATATGRTFAGRRGGFVLGRGLSSRRLRALAAGLLSCAARTRRSDAGCLAVHLAVVRRPGRITEPGSVVASRQLEQRIEGAD